MSPRIARWKIDTPVENWLSFKADNSEFWKRLYVLYYRIFDSKYYKGGLNFIDRYMSDFQDYWDPEKKVSVVRDMIYCLHRFGVDFQDYWSYDFISHQDLQYRESYISDKLRYHYCDILNAPELEALMTDKYSCYERYSRFYKREVELCTSDADREKFLSFASRHVSFIFKPLSSHSGRGICIVNTEETDMDVFFKERITQGAFIVEELIRQAYPLSSLHPASVNTVRVVSFVVGRKVSIFASTLRVGRGGAELDNAGSGGIYAIVDTEKGVVSTDAVDHKRNHYEKHPDTGITFNGFQLPAWEDAVQLIKDMALTVNGTTLVAWDIAFSDDGWVMVEANDNGAWRVIQSNRPSGLKDKLYSLMDGYFEHK